MKKVNYAAIDIGSNAVRLLIKRVNEEGSPEGLMSKVQLIRIPLRLGEDAMTWRQPRSTRPETLFPYTTRCRSGNFCVSCTALRNSGAIRRCL